MHSHPNALLTQKGRLRFVTQHLEHSCSLKELAAENSISLRCANRWLALYRSGAPVSLADRRSVRHTHRRTLEPQRLQHAEDLRHQRLHLRHTPRLLQAPFSTFAKVLSRLGLGRLRNLVAKVPVHATSGTGLAISSTSTSSRWQIRKVGHRITGERQQGHSYGVGYDKVDVAVDDATRLADVEVLEDEKNPTVVGFLSRAVAWFNGQGLMPARDERQRPGLRLPRVCQGLPAAH